MFLCLFLDIACVSVTISRLLTNSSVSSVLSQRLLIGRDAKQEEPRKGKDGSLPKTTIFECYRNHISDLDKAREVDGHEH